MTGERGWITCKKCGKVLSRCQCGPKVERGFMVRVYIGGRYAGQYVRGLPEDAERTARQMLVKKDREELKPSTHTTLGDYLRWWIANDTATKRGPKSFSTLAEYERMANVHIIPALGKVRLEKLNPGHLKDYIARKAGEGKSATTIQHHVRLMQAALQDAVQREVIHRNVAKLVETERADVHYTTLTEKHVEKFLETARSLHDLPESDPRHCYHSTLYLVTLATGIRAGEALGLRWEDVDLREGVINVRQSFLRRGKHTEFKAPKTEAGKRSIPISPAVVKALEAHRLDQETRKVLLGNVYQDAGLVFAQPNGKPLHGNNITRRDLKRVLKAAGLKPMKFHELRHTHGTLLHSHGVPLRVLQERLGHSDVLTTQRIYIHPTQQDRDHAADVWDSIQRGGAR